MSTLNCDENLNKSNMTTAGGNSPIQGRRVSILRKSFYKPKLDPHPQADE